MRWEASGRKFSVSTSPAGETVQFYIFTEVSCSWHDVHKKHSPPVLIKGLFSNSGGRTQSWWYDTQHHRCIRKNQTISLIVRKYVVGVYTFFPISLPHFFLYCLFTSLYPTFFVSLCQDTWDRRLTFRECWRFVSLLMPMPSLKCGCVTRLCSLPAYRGFSHCAAIFATVGVTQAPSSTTDQINWRLWCECAKPRWWTNISMSASPLCQCNGRKELVG